jgi:hypothetical protein
LERLGGLINAPGSQRLIPPEIMPKPIHLPGFKQEIGFVLPKRYHRFQDYIPIISLEQCRPPVL